jgi:hypothetical protein
MEKQDNSSYSIRLADLGAFLSYSFSRDLLIYQFNATEITTILVIISAGPVLDIVEEYELSFLEQDQAGAYEYQFADTLYSYLTDKNFRLDGPEGCIGLLICGCLCEGCWPVYATMEETPDRLVWKNFSNPRICGSRNRKHHYYYSSKNVLQHVVSA